MTTQIFVFLEISNGLAHTDVYGHILECRFTHFAPYVVTWWNLQKDLYFGTEGVHVSRQSSSFAPRVVH